MSVAMAHDQLRPAGLKNDRLCRAHGGSGRVETCERCGEAREDYGIRLKAPGLAPMEFDGTELLTYQTFRRLGSACQDVIEQWEIGREFLLIIGGRGVLNAQLEEAIRQTLDFVLPHSTCAVPGDSDLHSLYFGDAAIGLQTSRRSSTRIFETATLNPAFSVWIAPVEVNHRYASLRRLALIDRGTASDRETALLFELNCGVQLWSFLRKSDEVLLPLAQEQNGSILELGNLHAEVMLRELRDKRMLVSKKGMVLILNSNRQVGIAA